jgi:alpha-D-ribose 1-methylphosphonate 5-phosphate C-P lyase
MPTTTKITKKAQAAIDVRIQRAYGAGCSGIQINIFDLAKVSAVGAKLIAEGADDDKLRDGIRAFVETIRQN